MHTATEDATEVAASPSPFLHRDREHLPLHR
jgi:hypothetical protein